MSRGANLRKAVQLLVCRGVLTKYLEGEQLEAALNELKHEMRSGGGAWAFKRHAVGDELEAEGDDRTYYSSGGNV